MSARDPAPPGATEVAAPSRRLLFYFRLYLGWYLRRHFHALRLANASRFPVGERLIAFVNHPSWWDPLTILMVSHHLLPDCDHYGPMEARALQHYGLFRRLGAFPVAAGSAHAGHQLLHSAGQVLDRGGVLWITPEGRFTDIRTRPVIFKSGLARLLSQMGRVTLVPLAFEYTFWDERLPEILVNCGEPLRIADGRLEKPHTWNNLLTRAMTFTQAELGQLAATRQATNFQTIVAGGAGVSGLYEHWKKLQAGATGRHYYPEHGSITKR